MEEIWKDIDGYDGLYRISNEGRILSMKFGPQKLKNTSPKIMKQSISSSGYLHVQLYKNGKSSTKLIHILVANAFIPNLLNKPEVNHIDGNKKNNSANNLEWVTKSENAQHAIKNGLKPKPLMSGKCGSLSPVSKPVLQCDDFGNIIKVWDCAGDAAKFYGCRTNSIYRCISGTRKTCKGYVWKHKGIEP